MQRGESAEDTREAEETVTEQTGEGQETIAEPAGSEGLTISVPLNGHTGLSLQNLISMIYSRGRLISKATGGSFSCTEGLAEYLKDDSFITTAEKLIRAVADYEKGNDKALTGLTFEEDKVSFTGFPYTQDSDKVQAFQQLTAQMNKLAREQKRTQVKKLMKAMKSTSSASGYYALVWQERSSRRQGKFCLHRFPET